MTRCAGRSRAKHPFHLQLFCGEGAYCAVRCNPLGRGLRFRGRFMSEAKAGAPPSLDAVRQRIDALDTELLRLVDERASLARIVAEAKRAAGDGDKFALRPAREAQILRRLIAAERGAANPSLIVRIWREMIGDSLSVQGPFH